MEGIRTFLEASTIHGLSHISSTKKYVRLFWILVVLCGFSGAFFLIYESFQSWEESPITTTIETLPISQITLPKVTICPPRNSYTELNIDILRAKNITLDEETRVEIIDFVIEAFQNRSFKKYLRGNKIKDHYLYYNWYNGFRKILLQDGSTYQEYFDSWAPVGVITTEGYGMKYEADKLINSLRYTIEVTVPELIRANENFTLHFVLDKLSIGGLSTDTVEIEGLGELSSDITKIQHNYTPPANTWGGSRHMSLSSLISSEYMENIEISSMPGFNFTWYFSHLGNDTIPIQRKYFEEGNPFTKLFIRQNIQLNCRLLFNKLYF